MSNLHTNFFSISDWNFNVSNKTFPLNLNYEGKIVNYGQTSNTSCTIVDNKIVDHSDVVGAPTVGAAPATSSFST